MRGASATELEAINYSITATDDPQRQRREKQEMMRRRSGRLKNANFFHPNSHQRTSPPGSGSFPRAPFPVTSQSTHQPQLKNFANPPFAGGPGDLGAKTAFAYRANQHSSSPSSPSHLSHSATAQHTQAQPERAENKTPGGQDTEAGTRPRPHFCG